MSAYVVVTIDIHDPEGYEKYKALAPDSIGRHGGRYLTRGGAVEVLEGEWPKRRFVILDFPDMDAARRWHASAEYAGPKAMRQAASTTVMLLAEGLPVPFAPGEANNPA